MKKEKPLTKKQFRSVLVCFERAVLERHSPNITYEERYHRFDNASRLFETLLLAYAAALEARRG